MQSRIVLRDSVLERGEELLRATKLGSLTELINVMFARYGGHLEQTWEVKPMFPSLTQPEVSPKLDRVLRYYQNPISGSTNP
jgi:hypothetical protein